MDEARVIRDAERAYGCLFCVTGYEMVVAKQIQTACPEVRAIVARQEKFKSIHGKKTKIEAVLLPSYVFFEAPRNMKPQMEFPRPNIIRVLSHDGEWPLCGNDEKFTKWLFRYEGLLGFSKAYREGERIRIVSGPLKDLEGQIKRVDKRGRSGQISLEFNDRIIQVWLGFDLLDPLTMNADQE